MVDRIVALYCRGREIGFVIFYRDDKEEDRLYKTPGIYGVRNVETINSASIVGKVFKTIPGRAIGAIAF